MRRHPPRRRALAFLLAVLVAGCYTYVPLEDGLPEGGEEVRIHLAAGEAGAGASTPDRDAPLQGVVVASDPDSLSFWRRPVSRSGVLLDEVRRDTLAVATSEVDRIERSRLDPVKTGGLVLGGLGLIAGVALLVANAEAGGTGDVGNGGGGGTLNIRITLP